ncbi:MAG: AlpA family phage regulatory protein [Desulfamplus sp.]|nr:AlpA family phage regulatory protein [Desulfamplus sp.]
MINNNITPLRPEAITPTQQALPSTGFLRLWQIVGDKKRDIPALIPVSKSSWWTGCKTGKYPKPVKLSERTTVWRVEDIRRLINNA